MNLFLSVSLIILLYSRYFFSDVVTFRVASFVFLDASGLNILLTIRYLLELKLLRFKDAIFLFDRLIDDGR